MKKFLLFLLVLSLIPMISGCKNNDSENGDGPLEVTNGTNVAKILLAQERLDQDVLYDNDKIFVSGKKAFEDVARLTRLSTQRLAKRPNETYTEVEGDTYKWYNDVDYSNFLEFFYSYSDSIEINAQNGADLIDYTKKNIRVVNSWINSGGTNYFLIVEEDMEIIIQRSQDGYVQMCKRYTNDMGDSVYEMLDISEETKTRMKYIPGLVYEFSIGRSSLDKYDVHILADKYKGYWQIMTTNGLGNYEIDGENVEVIDFRTLVMKEEATYLLSYHINSTGYTYLGDIQLVSSDGKSDLLSLSLNNITLFNTGVKGLDHIELTAPKDKVGKYYPNITEEYYIYESDNINENGEKYKIYSTSGVKSATAVCENGVTLTEGDQFLDGKAYIGRVDVSYVAGCESYGIIPIGITANTLEEQFENLEDILEYTGLTFRRDYDTIISGLEYAINDAHNFPQFYTFNGYHINDLEEAKKGLEAENNKGEDLFDLYNQIKDLEVIDIEDQEKYNSKIHFTTLTTINSGTIINDGFKINVTDLKVKVDDTLLFVDKEQYKIVIGLLSEENNVIAFIDEGDLKFEYIKGQDFELNQNKELNVGLLETGKYVLVAYVALDNENIRVSNYIKLNANVTETSYSQDGFINTIKSENGNLIIQSNIDYNLHYELTGEFTPLELVNEMGQKAYEHGMNDDFELEMLNGETWVKVDLESDSNVKYTEGQFRMKYIANSKDKSKENYVYVTLNEN